jgi:hypothetical protein
MGSKSPFVGFCFIKADIIKKVSPSLLKNRSSV